MKRVLAAAMSHESNSFNPIIAGEKDFQVLRGEDVIRRRAANDALTGILNTLEAAGYTPVPTLFVSAVPNGLVDRQFYDRVRSEILSIARQEQEKAPLDAVTLALHGSMTTTDLGDAEGLLLEGLRAVLPETPIFCSLDMHTTMTKRMYRNADGFVGFKCAPHTDRLETGIHAAKMTIRALETGVKACTAWVKVPLLIAGEQSSTTVEPMRGLIAELRRTETLPGIWAASYLMGFPWCDNPDSACAVCVTADTQEQADREALRLAELLWDTRKKFCFQVETYPESTALDVAFDALSSGAETPIYLSDSGDNPTAGSSSDCVGFLKRLMDDPRTGTLRSPVLYGGVYDPEATLRCKGNVGKTLTLTFGAKFDRETTAPITAEGTVMAYLPGWNKFPGNKSDIALFRTHGVDVVLAEKHIGYVIPDVFRDLGREPGDADLVVCKLGYLTADQARVAKRSIIVLTKGSTNEDLATLPYCRTPRPIFPLDECENYVPAIGLISKDDTQ